MDLGLIVERIGLPLLTFCLGRREDDGAPQWLGDASLLPARSREAAAQCATLVEEAAPGVYGVFDALCVPRDGGEWSVAVELFLMAGGELPTPPDGDDVAAALAPLVTDAFAALLLAEPAWREQVRAMEELQRIAQGVNPNLLVVLDPRLPPSPQIEGWLFPIVLKHPHFGNVTAGFEEDRGIAGLFRAGRRDPVPTVIWASSLGHAQTVQRPSLAWMLLAEGYRRLRALARPLAEQSFFDEVIAALQIVRAAAASGRADVPAIVALRGGHLSHAGGLKTRIGTLRPLNSRDLELAPPGASGDVVLETTVPIGVALGRDLNTTEPPADVVPAWKVLRERAELVGEASVISHGSPLVATWQVVLDPFALSLRPLPEPLATRPPLESLLIDEELRRWIDLTAAMTTDHGVTLARARLFDATLRGNLKMLSSMP